MSPLITQPPNNAYNYPNNPINSIPTNTTKGSIITPLNNTTHNLIYSLSPSIKANTIPKNTKAPKNNYLNNKTTTPFTYNNTLTTSSYNTGTIPKQTSNPHLASTPNLTNKNITSPPNSPEADDPVPLPQSLIDSSTTSNESIDIMRDNENETIVNQVSPKSTTPKQLNLRNPSLTSSDKIKLINKTITSNNPNSLGPLSPIERKAIKILGSRTRNSIAKLKFQNNKNITMNSSFKHD